MNAGKQCAMFCNYVYIYTPIHVYIYTYLLLKFTIKQKTLFTEYAYWCHKILILYKSVFAVYCYNGVTLKVPMTDIFFIFLLDSTLGSHAKTEKKIPSKDFPSPRFSRLKT